ncbi:MAG: DUF349 domain-containing protein [Bacteroides sp.]|nr:DUF349 domain-containing protein [Bacteroidales bacterium]MBD5304088.1 DUF349 domain-containing protein [Bacteroides sp.]
MNDLEKTTSEEELIISTPSETEEAPVNYHNMSKEELNAAVRTILADNNMEAHRDITAIKQAFFNIRSRESLEEVNAFVEAGNDPKDFSSQVDEQEAEFKKLYAEFKERRAQYLAAEEARRAENLAKKQEILDKIKSIAEDIDNVNVKFAEFQQLQQDFKEIKDVPATAETEIWKNFQAVVEQYYDHLKMNKELRDLDFKKNLEAKKNLVAEAHKLENEADVIAAFRALQGLHDEWRNIGPVAKEIREELWNEFKEASTVINKRHQDYFEQRKAAEQANEEAKTKLCEEIESIDLNELTSFNAWATATEKVIELQKKWKEYGYASKKANVALYSRFRKACDDFFNRKTEYFQKTKDEFNANLEKKTRLCERAEALKEQEDINKAANEVVKLQAEWKKVGSVPRKQSDAIWERFQTACNYIFDERKKLHSARRDEEMANLDAKRAVIAKLKELPLDGERREVIGKVKELQEEWQKIGFVPFKMKDKVYAEYREICDALYGSYQAKEDKARMSNFRNRVNEMKDGGQKLDRERDKLVRALEARKSELKTIENNMGFFNVKSSAGNSMLKEMENKIKRLKEDMRQIEEKIAILDAEA